MNISVRQTVSKLLLHRSLFTFEHEYQCAIVEIKYYYPMVLQYKFIYWLYMDIKPW